MRYTEAQIAALEQKTRGLVLHGGPPERDILAGTLELLRYHKRAAWAERISTGKGYLLRGVTPQRLSALYASGLLKPAEVRWIEFGFSGCSDILGELTDGRILAIETKQAGAYAKPHQRQFLETVQKNGGVAGIARSVDDVIRLLDNA